MKNPQHTPNENSVGQIDQIQKKSVLQKLRQAFLNKYAVIVLGTATLASCTTDDPIDPEPQNNAPTVTLTNVVSNDDTNTVSGKLTANDSDGTVEQRSVKAETIDGMQVNIALNADGTFSHTFTNSGKVFNALIANAKDDDDAPQKLLKI